MFNRRYFLQGLGSAGIAISGEPNRIAYRQPTASQFRPIASAPTFLRVEDYRAPTDRRVDDGPALQRAMNAAAAARLAVRVPDSGLNIATQAVIPDGTVLEGTGPGSVITGACGQFLIATGKNKITLRNLGLAVTHNSYWPDFRAISQLSFENVTSSAFEDHAAGLTAFGLRIRGCGNVIIDRCRFLNSNDALYLEAYQGINCGTALVTKSWFEHTTHGKAGAAAIAEWTSKRPRASSTHVRRCP